MGWEFAALWNDETTPWQWVWRRVADDSGEVLEQSSLFVQLEDCIADAKRHGFESEVPGGREV